MSSKYFKDKKEEDMNAKERRLEKRKAKKAMLESRAELVQRIKANPPGERMSYYGHCYTSSTEGDWEYMPWLHGIFAGVWVYKTEMPTFLRGHNKCEINNKWAENGSLAQVIESDQSDSPPKTRWMIPEEARKLGFAYCSFSSCWYKESDMAEVWNDLNNKCCVHKQYLGSYHKCDYTGKLFDPAHLVPVSRSDKYKRVCRFLVNNQQFGRCRDCNQYLESAIVPYRPSGHYICENCWEIRELGNLINPYNFKNYLKPIHSPSKVWRVSGGDKCKDEHGFPMFTGKRKSEQVENPSIRLFGWEAETEICRKSAHKDGLNRNKLANQVIKTLGKDFVYIVEDGTLTANEHYSKGTGFSGFEIVSAPADLEAHRKYVPRFHDIAGFKHFRAWDEYDTCGFHVHVSRDALTPLQIGRMLMFVNHKNNAKFIFKVAGRGSDRFCKYIPKEPGDKTHPATDVLYPSERVVSKEEEKSRDRSRRVALNLSNQKTVEFRIFRGTVHPRHILRNLEFCDAVCDYCYPGNFSIQDMANYEVFISFVSKNRKRWPLFAEWLVNQKILEMKALSEKANLEKVTINPANSVEVDREPAQKQEPVKKKSSIEELMYMIPDLNGMPTPPQQTKIEPPWADFNPFSTKTKITKSKYPVVESDEQDTNF